MAVYLIRDLVFDPEACEITLGGQVQHVQPQVRNVLLSLVNHPGEVVSKDLLAEEAWHGRRMSDESVTRCISLLRRHFQSCGEQNLIETIPRVGYRFKAPVRVEDANALRGGGYLDYASAHGVVPAKTAVNLLVTAAVIALLLSTLLLASDFLPLKP